MNSLHSPGKKTIFFFFFSIILLIAVPLQVLSQDVRMTIDGIVVDEKGEAITGVSVSVKGTTTGTITDIDGKFTLSANANNTISFSFLGYQPVDMQADKVGRNAKIVLNENATILEDIVVVGYGSQKKETLTGSISKISGEEIITTTHSSLAQNLQGKVPGLQIRQNSGEPGDFNTMINIRGFGNPLYVIDGIPQDDGASDFQRLNPQDIESISIIKDASAAIYGLRAGNGVIIVTTKKGAQGKPRFAYSGVFGWQKPTEMPAMANRSQWAEMWNDTGVNSNGVPIFTKEQLAEHMTGASTDWYGATMKNSATQTQHNVSVTGGADIGSYFVSFGYVKENGLLKSDDLNYDKYTFRTNLSINLSKRLKADVNLSGRIDTKNAPSGGFYNIFNGTRTAFPHSPIYANDNPEYLALQKYINPIPYSRKDMSGYTEDKNKAFQGSVSVAYDFPYLEGLTLKGMAAYNTRLLTNKTLVKKYNLYTYDETQENPYIAHAQNTTQSISNANTDIDNVTLQAQIVYSRTFNEAHKVDATLVYEQQEYNSRQSSLSREYDFYTGDQINQAGLNNQKANGIEEERASLSYIGKFNYGYKGKYLVEFAFRNDGSYRYHKDRRWGFFPVGSIGWRMSEESFMKGISFLSNLKLRASYGQVGEDAGAPFQHIQGYSLTGGGGYEFVDGSWTNGAASPAIVNENLTWFKSNIADVGIDVGLFNSRLNVEFDVYQRDRKGLLSTRLVSLPNTFGGTLPEENLNSDRVRGFDLSVSYSDKIDKFSFGVKANLNFARTMNRYVERGPYANSMDKWRNGNSNRWNDVGWGYILEGQFQSDMEIAYAPPQNGDLGNLKELPGDYRYKDVNGDGLIDTNDMVPLFWTGSPKLFYGFTLNGEWNGFDFNALIQGSGKYSVRFKEVYAEIFAFGLNTPAYFHDRWHLEDPYNPDSEWVAGKWPASRVVADVGAIYNESIIWRKDASYVRLKSLELGYTLPKKIVRKIGFENVRFFVTGHNLFTITDSFVKPFDPEKIEGAYSAGFTYPLTKSYNIGVNVNF